jgi:hypothetical protein
MRMHSASVTSPNTTSLPAGYITGRSDIVIKSFTTTRFVTADEFLAYAKQEIIAQGYDVLTAWQEDNQVAYTCSVQFDGTGMYASPKVSYSWRFGR